MNRTVTACLFEGPFEELPTWQEMLDAGAGRLSAAGVAEAELTPGTCFPTAFFL